MRVPALDLPRQHASLQGLREAFERVLGHGQFVGLVGNKELELFEECFAHFVGCSGAAGVASGTAALLLALRAMGIAPGESPPVEVITTPFTFAATAEAIVNAGAVPVFADIDETFCLDPARVEAALTPRTRGLLPVHLYGYPANMGALTKLARARGLFVVEDAAQAHGARYKGRPCGTLGDLACFSFHPSKNLGALGDGGAVTSNRPELLDVVRRLRDHGRTDKYTYAEVGFGERLDALQAAFLLVKLARLDEWNARRRQIAAHYDARLSDLGIVPALPAPADLAHARHLYVIRVDGGRRDALQAALNAKGIAAAVHYPVGLHHQPAFEKYAPGREFPKTDRAAAEVLSLPIFPEMTDDQVDYVAENVRAALT